MLWGNSVIFTDHGENPMITIGFTLLTFAVYIRSFEGTGIKRRV